MKLPKKYLLKVKPEIVLLAIFNIFFHLVFYKNLEFHRDEMLYFSFGLHPDTGYATVPPLIGWIAMVMQNIFGYSVFSVRLFPAVLSGAMIILADAISRELGGSRYASILSGIGLTISIFFMRSFSLFHPVHIEIFLWTTCIYLLIKYINTQKDKFLLIFGLFAGIALLNKYLAGLLFLSLVIVIPFTEHKTVFRKKTFWYGLAVGFIVFLPNLLWQISRDFPVFSHMTELRDTQLVYMDIPTFLTEQLIMPFAGSVMTVAGLIFLLTTKKAKRFRFLGITVLIVISALMLMKGKSYYTLGVFPLLIIAGAVLYDNWIKPVWLRAVFPLLMVLITIPAVPIGLPVYGKEGLKTYFKNLDEKYGIDLGRRFEDGTIHSLPQDYADMIGWEELTTLTDKAYRLIPDKDAAFIYCENYGQAGAITVIGKKYGLPEAICFSESFGYWYPEKFDPDITSAIYINDELGEDIQMLFKEITEVGRISDPDAREYGTTVYLCREPHDSFNKFWQLRLKELREED